MSKIAEVIDKQSKEEKRKCFQELAFELCHGKGLSHKYLEDFKGREIIITPFDGNYGRAGYVIVINGSPPRGVFIISEDAITNYGADIVYIGSARNKRFATWPDGTGYTKSKIILDFLKSEIN